MPGANGAGVVRFIRGAAGADAGGLPDGELLRRFAAGADEGAFRALVARHGPVVWAVCRRLLRNHHDAEDAFQATLLVLARGAGGIRSGAAVGGWLCGVAARVAGRVRSRRRPDPAPAEPAAGHPDGALGDLTVREAEAALYAELARLPDRCRAALVLCGLEGLTRDEAAARLGWSANRLKHALERGRELLRARLARRGVTLAVPLLAGLLSPPAAVAAPLAEAAVRHATGVVAPPAAVSSLAHGVTRTMWIAKWKWAALGVAALGLAGGTLAAGLVQPPAAPPAPAARAGLNLVPAGDPAPAPKPEKETPKPAWDVATEYLQLIIDGKPERALKLGDDLRDRHTKEIQVAGLKRVKVAMILMNGTRVMVVTERAKLKRRPDADPTDEHVAVTLERADVGKPWRVRESDVADERKVLREVGDYLAGKFPVPPAAALRAEPERPRQPWDLASEFLIHALNGRTDEALKLTVPGTVSENKAGEIKKWGYTRAAPAAVLVNDTRMTVVFDEAQEEKGRHQHLALMLVKGKDGAWLVKDVDADDAGGVEEKVKLYLAGRYDEKPKKD